MRMTKTPYIQLEDINFSYGENPVLEGVTFSVFQGDYVGIIGPNGGGKTTLVKIIVGLIEPDSGAVRIMGHDVHNLKERSVVGYVPQRIAQTERRFPATVEEIVRSGRIVKKGIWGSFGRSDQDIIERVMEMTGVNGLRHRLIGNLSGGEMQKVFIARALAGEPKILILDEPLAGVDIASQKKFYEFLGELNRKHNLTVIFVSHDVDVVSNEAKSVICLNRTLVCEGPSSQLRDESVIKKLYGDKMNVVIHKQ